MDTGSPGLIATAEHEPLLRIENEGLVIQAFEIEGECVLDFDWPSDSRWTFLEDETAFEAFAIQWLEEVTGQALSAADMEQLKVSVPLRMEERSGDNQAQQDESEQGEAGQGAR